MSPLSPQDIKPALKPEILKQVLSTSIIKQIYDDAVKVRKWDANKEAAFLNILKDPTNKLINIDELASIMHLVAVTVISHWVEAQTTGGMEKVIIDMMKASYPLFKEMSKTVPQINLSGYKYAFRGTNSGLNSIRQYVQSTDPNDWKQVKLSSKGGTRKSDKYVTYVGPESKRFIYKPHNAVQSWSVDVNSADKFGSATVAVAIDESFLFNPQYLNYLGRKENEVIHFGNQPMPVIVMLPTSVYTAYRHNTKASLQESDKEGTLIVPTIK